jgi:hypothetical protein
VKTALEIGRPGIAGAARIIFGVANVADVSSVGLVANRLRHRHVPVDLEIVQARKFVRAFQLSEIERAGDVLEVQRVEDGGVAVEAAFELRRRVVRRLAMQTRDANLRMLRELVGGGAEGAPADAVDALIAIEAVGNADAEFTVRSLRVRVVAQQDLANLVGSAVAQSGQHP